MYFYTQYILCWKSEKSCTLTPNKVYAYPLNVEPSNLLFLKTYNTYFDNIFIIFTHQNGRLVEIEGKGELRVPVNK